MSYDDIKILVAEKNPPNKEAFTKRLDEVIEFLNSETEIEIFEMSMDILPEDISDLHYRMLAAFIKEE